MEVPSVRGLTLVESEAFLVQIAEQVIRLHAHVGAANHPLEQRPEVLDTVRVDLAVYVSFGVVDDTVDVLRVEPLVGRQRIRHQFRATRHDGPYMRLERAPR